MSYIYVVNPAPSTCFCAGYVIATHSTTDEGPPLTTTSSPNYPRVIATPCPQGCAIIVQGEYYPATILNAPRMGTVPLPEPREPLIFQLPTPPPSPQSTAVANRRLR